MQIAIAGMKARRVKKKRSYFVQVQRRKEIRPRFQTQDLEKLSAPLQLLEELTRRAGNIDSARNPALAIFHALDDARRLAALGAIRTLACVHYLFTVRCFC